MSLVLFIAVIAVSMLISLGAMWWLRSVYSKYSQIAISSGKTGAQVAQEILHAANIYDVEVVPIQGSLTDHYDPINKRLALSLANYEGRSIAAAGVSAHEAGHAIQHKVNYAPLNWRMAAVGAAQFGSSIVMWVPLIGMFTGIITSYAWLAGIMATGFGLILIFQLITLPVEFDASRRANIILSKMGFVSVSEAQGVRSVLTAAGMTYVAAVVGTLLWMLYYLLPLLLSNRD